MTSPLARRHVARVAAALFASLTVAGAAGAAPTPVSLDVRLDNGSWVPLPPDQMKSATVDAALARISEGGWLWIVPQGKASEGALVVDVNLVWKAQIAKAVLTLDIPGEATYVANASVSVRGLDGQGFHRAFEHVGVTAADRLHSMLEARRGGPARIVDDADDTHWRETYNRAQELKHAGQYAEARVLFEQVVDATGRGTHRLARMAEDELRYGLPVMEARQTLVGLSGPQGAGQFLPAVTRAEGLYRQIQAENPTNVQRLQEAQQALDQLAVMRHHYEQAARTQVVMRVHSMKMIMAEHLMMEGRCPDRADFARMLEYATFPLSAGQVSVAADGSGRYSIIDDESGIAVPVTCDGRGRIDFDLGRVQAPRPARGR